MNTINFFKKKWVGLVFRVLLLITIVDLFYIYGSALLYRISDLLNQTPQPLLGVKICFDILIIISLLMFIYVKFFKKDENIWLVVVPIVLMLIYQIILALSIYYITNKFTENYILAWTLAVARIISLFLLYLIDFTFIHFRKA